MPADLACQGSWHAHDKKLEYRNTKITATIGPASSSVTMLTKLVKAGLNVARLNFSHGTFREHAGFIERIRSIAKQLNVPVAILQDVPGPKLRVGQLPKEGLELKTGDEVVFTCDRRIDTFNGADGRIPINFDRLCMDVRPRHRLLLDDGKVEARVIKVAGEDVHTAITVGGMLSSHKGIIAPESDIKLGAITGADVKAIQFGVEQGVDYLALSFVRDASDIAEAKELLRAQKAEHIKVIAKIERSEGVKNFDEILAAADAIMVARGDLALEVGAAKVPILQKQFIVKCRLVAKPVIVATQMLESMMNNPRPTRAEVSDVANAVIDHTDAIMLSGESATGKYPYEAVWTMDEVARTTEASPYDDASTPSYNVTKGNAGLLGVAAFHAAHDQDVDAIVLPTVSGQTARAVAAVRPGKPIIALTDNRQVYQQLALVWGVTPVYTEDFKKLVEPVAKDELRKLLSAVLKDATMDKVLTVASLEQDLAIDDALRIINFPSHG